MMKIAKIQTNIELYNVRVEPTRTFLDHVGRLEGQSYPVCGRISTVESTRTFLDEGLGVGRLGCMFHAMHDRLK